MLCSQNTLKNNLKLELHCFKDNVQETNYQQMIGNNFVYPKNIPQIMSYHSVVNPIS